MTGAKIVNGIFNTQIKAGMKAILIKSAIKFAAYRLEIKPQTKSG